MTLIPLREIVLAVVLVTAGCLGGPLEGESGEQPGTTATESTTTTSPTADTTPLPRATYPEPPSDLIGESVKRSAISYEEARLQNKLRNEREITYFSLGYTRPVDATVLNESDDGIYVRIDGSYSYATAEVEADGVPVHSLYKVNGTSITYVKDAEG